MVKITAKDKRLMLLIIRSLSLLLDEFLCQKSKLDCGTFIPNEAYPLLFAKATYKQLGESNYFKIIVNHFRNDVDKLKEIDLTGVQI